MTLRDRVVEGVLATAALLSIGATITIAGSLFVEGAAFLRSVPASSVWLSLRFNPLFDPAAYGIWPLLAGTALVAVLALALALPAALFLSIFLAEYTTPRLRGVLKVGLDVLAGVPSVVYGFFALAYVSPLLQRLVPGLGPFSALAGAVVLAAMILPFIASLSDDAIYAVPLSVREAGHALGGTKLSVVLRVVLPNAASGITAAVFLGIARAMGETMIVLIACGLEPSLSLDPRVAVDTLAAFIAQATLSDAGAQATRLLFFVASVLFVFTFSLNAISARWRRRFLRRAP